MNWGKIVESFAIRVSELLTTASRCVHRVCIALIRPPVKGGLYGLAVHPIIDPLRIATELGMGNEKVVFLFDVDNTLLDNDRVIADLMRHLEGAIGSERQQRYWTIFEQLRTQLGYADYLGALQRYRVENPRDTHMIAISHYLVNYPFATRLFPGALDVVEHCQKFGQCVILSDGDVVFQPLKVERSGLAESFDGNVLIYIHKELELDDIIARYPADHYILIDDKVRILAAVKKAWGARLTTVFPRQGHYALDAEEVAKYPNPDIAIERIGLLLDFDLKTLIGAATAPLTAKS